MIGFLIKESIVPGVVQQRLVIKTNSVK